MDEVDEPENGDAPQPSSVRSSGRSRKDPNSPFIQCLISAFQRLEDTDFDRIQRVLEPCMVAASTAAARVDTTHLAAKNLFVQLVACILFCDPATIEASVILELACLNPAALDRFMSARDSRLGVILTRVAKIGEHCASGFDGVGWTSMAVGALCSATKAINCGILSAATCAVAVAAPGVFAAHAVSAVAAVPAVPAVAPAPVAAPAGAAVPALAVAVAAVPGAAAAHAPVGLFQLAFWNVGLGYRAGHWGIGYDGLVTWTDAVYANEMRAGLFFLCVMLALVRRRGTSVAYVASTLGPTHAVVLRPRLFVADVCTTLCGCVGLEKDDPDPVYRVLDDPDPVYRVLPSHRFYHLSGVGVQVARCGGGKSTTYLQLMKSIAAAVHGIPVLSASAEVQSTFTALLAGARVALNLELIHAPVPTDDQALCRRRAILGLVLNALAANAADTFLTDPDGAGAIISKGAIAALLADCPDATATHMALRGAGTSHAYLPGPLGGADGINLGGFPTIHKAFSTFDDFTSWAQSQKSSPRAPARVHGASLLSQLVALFTSMRLTGRTPSWCETGSTYFFASRLRSDFVCHPALRSGIERNYAGSAAAKGGMSMQKRMDTVEDGINGAPNNSDSRVQHYHYLQRLVSDGTICRDDIVVTIGEVGACAVEGGQFPIGGAWLVARAREAMTIEDHWNDSRLLNVLPTCVTLGGGFDSESARIAGEARRGSVGVSG